MFVADRFGIFIAAHLGIEPASGVFAARLAGQCQPPFAKALLQKIFIEATEIADGANAQSMQVLLRHLADSRDTPNLQRRQKPRFVLGQHPEHTVEHVTRITPESSRAVSLIRNSRSPMAASTRSA